MDVLFFGGVVIDRRNKDDNKRGFQECLMRVTKIVIKHTKAVYLPASLPMGLQFYSSSTLRRSCASL
jgi:hypothetical protein